MREQTQDDMRLVIVWLVRLSEGTNTRGYIETCHSVDVRLSERTNTRGYIETCHSVAVRLSEGTNTR